MSLIKKLASVFGKKDAPKKKEAPKQQKPASTHKKKQQTKPGQEEWRPGDKTTPRPKQQRRKPQGGGKPQSGQNRPPRKKKPANEPFVLTAEEQARMKEFRPEEEDRRIAYEQRLRQRRGATSGDGKPQREERTR
ncbi:MAG: hypothetical protein OES84_06255, partial [Kiritimatiellaceae bacterium]|nr:hypothetical protein [Kiritimatiellaceae bacterium]